MRAIASLLLAATLAGCGSPADAPAVAPKDEAPKATPALSEPREIASDTFAVVILHQDDRPSIEREAREICAGKDFCKVLGWQDPDLAPRGFPMTDREVEGQKFSYSLNRQTGLDEALWL